MNDRLIALIPAYNEAAAVGDVIRQVRVHVDEVVVVDDGSQDETTQRAKEAGATVIRHEHNQGKGAAILTGLDYFGRSDAAYIIFLDADGQHDPAEIPGFKEVVRATGAGIVVGNRMGETRHMPAVRRWTNQFTSWVTSRLAQQRVPDSQCGYRLLARRVLADLKLTSSHFETETEMLIQAGRAGHRIACVPVRTIYLSGRASHIRPWQDTVRYMKLVWRYRR